MNKQPFDQQRDEGSTLTGAASAIMKEVLRPLVVLGIRGAMGVRERTKYFASLAREEIEDIIAEAQFETMKKQYDQDLQENTAAGVNQLDERGNDEG